MDYKSEYKRWLDRVDDEALKAELADIQDDEAEQIARFGCELEFGTAGLRGHIGAGTSRMNIYTVRRTTQGLADYIISRYGEGVVAIAYDSRIMSLEFARECASVLAGNGITAYIYDRLMPTPMLSFAVRELSARAGIMITASHNPAEYNGYKVFGSDGCQMTLEDTMLVYNKINETDMFDDVKLLDFEDGLNQELVKYIGKRTVERYYENVEMQQLNHGICEKYPVSVLYSPLHGAGNEPVRRVLDDVFVHNVEVVKAQEQPDGNFPTCPYPNPETKEALQLGLHMCQELKPDIFFATDPDADRVGVAIKEGDDYRILTGNEVGVLLLKYIIESRLAGKTMPKNPVAVRSIVSTALADDIAKDGGVEMRAVMTGFKFIGEQILVLEQNGEQDRFIFGFEESCGYLAGTYVRDKDAVVACMLLCEMASFYKQRSKPLVVVLEEIYEKYGYYRNTVVNIQFIGPNGSSDMKTVMESLFAKHPESIAGIPVTAVSDYRGGIRESKTLGTKIAIDLPSSDVIEFVLENGASVIIRPSGTEPKMKIYITVKEATAEASEKLGQELALAAEQLVKAVNSNK